MIDLDLYSGDKQANGQVQKKKNANETENLYMANFSGEIANSRDEEENWKSNRNHVVCGNPETTYHIMFQHILATFVRYSFKEALVWDKITYIMA